MTADWFSLGVNGKNGVARVCGAKAGSKITFEYRYWPDGSQPGAIDISHKGPCEVYMKKVDSAIKDQAIGGGWFSIYRDDYDSASKKWCTEKLITNNGYLSVTIPKDLQPGNYLIRPAMLALHQADKYPPDPQFYVGCAQVFLTSNGAAKPQNTVSIPGYVSFKDPAMTYHVWDNELKPFQWFGATPYTGGSGTKRDLEVRADTLKQTEGFEPPNCLIRNNNWCGTKLPASTDEGSCWAVRLRFYPHETGQDKYPLTVFLRPPKTAMTNLANATIRPVPPVIKAAQPGKLTADESRTGAVQVTSEAHHLQTHTYPLHQRISTNWTRVRQLQ